MTQTREQALAAWARQIANAQARIMGDNVPLAWTEQRGRAAKKEKKS